MHKNQFRYAVFLVAPCLLNTLLFSQTTAPAKQWDKRFGGRGYDDLRSVKPTTDGGYILGGHSNSGASGDKTENSRGDYDYWIVKTDANGVKQWDKRFGGSGWEYLYGLQQTTDGGYILGGESYSGIGGDKTEDSRGGTDYWIVKTDENGVKQWDKRFGGDWGEVLYSLQQTSDGGYILGGYSTSGIAGDKTQDSRGSSDFWIVKTDSNGVKQWDKRFGGSEGDFIYCLQQTSDGGYILGGASSSGMSGDKTEDNRGFEYSTDYWIVKTDSNGTKQWDKRFGGSNYDWLFSVQQTTDGGYILGGVSGSGIGGDKTEDSRGNDDIWIVKTDPNGVKLWDKRFGGSGVDNLSSLEQTSDGGYILGGSSASGIGGDKTEDSRGSGDFWMVKTDSSGVKQWDKRFGGSDNDACRSLRQITDGGYILGGISLSNSGGDKTEDSRGSVDFWMVKTGPEVLSVSLLNFKATKEEKSNVSLKWQTATENNTAYFIIEHSVNGTTFSPIASVTAAGNSNTEKDYQFIHTNPQKGTNFYRLKVVDMDDKFSYSATVRVNFDNGSGILVYPNPSKGAVTILYNKSTAIIRFTVFDASGKKVFMQTGKTIPGDNIYKLNLSNLQPGLYNLQVNNGSETDNVKFIIEK